MLLGFAVLGVVLSPWRSLVLVLVGPAVAAGVFVVRATTRSVRTSSVVRAVVGTTLGVCALIGAGHELGWACAATGCLGASAPATWRRIAGQPTTHRADR